MSKFFTYDQNNSGGRFDVDRGSGITDVVIIEADSAAEANFRAQEIGLYFDGYRNTAYVHPKVGAFYLVEVKS